MAFTPERLCLGVVGVEFFSRTPESLGKARERRNDPIESKESFRWLKGYRLACELAAAYPTTQIVSVADCECDIYDIFLESQEHDTPADFVIRANQDRRIPEPDSEAGTNAYRRVVDEVATSPLMATRQIDLPRTPKRQPRQATLEIRAMQVQVQVKPPAHRRDLNEVTYNVVLVEEVGGPGDGTDVCWLLITSLPIDSVKSVLLVLDYYVARWPIEVFFRVFKTGCRVEDIQLETT
ncbi:MAG: IS4 family transposase [Pirellulaceae bacterium]